MEKKMGFARTVKLLQYRMAMRKALQKASIEELRIALEETRKEIESRNKKQ